MKRGTDNNLFWTLFLLRTFSISLFFLFISIQKYISEQLLDDDFVVTVSILHMLLICPNLIKISNEFQNSIVGIISAVSLKNSKPKHE